MAKFMLSNASVTVNGVDISDHVRSVEVQMQKPALDVTAMGDTGQRRLQGLSDDSFVLNLYQDFASSETDATLNGLYSAATEFETVVKPVNTTTGATNPRYVGAACLIDSYPPITGEVGSVAMAQVTIYVQGTGIDRQETGT